MTTCVWDGKQLAGDTRQVHGNRIERCRKIFELPDGSVIAIAGTALLGEQMRLWLSGLGPKPKLRDTEDEEGQCMVLHIVGPDEAYDYTNSTIPLPALPPYAIGSGAQAAIALVECAGMTASEALVSMIKHEVDLYTGGAVDCIDTTKIERTTQKPRITYKRRRPKSTN